MPRVAAFGFGLIAAVAAPAAAAHGLVGVAAFVERAADDGSLRIEQVRSARSGDRLLFRSRLDEPRRRAPYVTAAIPRGVELIDALGNAEGSLDGGHSFAPLNRLGGRTGGVTHLRWRRAAHGGALPAAILFRARVV